MLGQVQSVNIEDIPPEMRNAVWEQLSINGGNVIFVEIGNPFSDWLVSQGFVFNMPRLDDHPKTWAWLVVFR